MRVHVRVTPGARRTQVGGRYGDEEPPVLLVRVTAPAVDGRADAAVIDAVAEAFGLRRSDVTITSGAASRRKVLNVVDADPSRLDQLLRS